MSITRKLLRSSGIYYKNNPKQLYVDLNEHDSLKNRIYPNRKRGLGKIFQKNTRHSLIEQALEINDGEGTIAIKDLNKLMELAKALGNGSSSEKIKKNIKKHEICLALIYYAAGKEKKFHKLRARTLRLLKETRDNKLRTLLIHIHVSPRQSYENFPPVETNSVNSTEWLLSVSRIAPSNFDNPDYFDNNETSTTSDSESSIADAEEKSEEKSDISLPPIDTQNSFSTSNPIQQKISQESYSDLLKNFESEYFKDKKYLRNWFSDKIKKLEPNELLKLLNYMIAVQNGKKDHLFSEIRRERYYPWSEGNTNTWQYITSQLKETIVNKLEKNDSLSEQEYYDYYNALNTPTGRLRFFDYRQTTQAEQFSKQHSNIFLTKKYTSI